MMRSLFAAATDPATRPLSDATGEASVHPGTGESRDTHFVVRRELTDGRLAFARHSAHAVAMRVSAVISRDVMRLAFERGRISKEHTPRIQLVVRSHPGSRARMDRGDYGCSAPRPALTNDGASRGGRP